MHFDPDARVFVRSNWHKYNEMKSQTTDFYLIWGFWRRGVVVIATAQLRSTKPELKFCAGSNPACGVSEIRNGEDLWQWS